MTEPGWEIGRTTAAFAELMWRLDDRGGADRFTGRAVGLDRREVRGLGESIRVQRLARRLIGISC